MNSKFRFSIFLALIGAMMAFAAIAPAQTQDYPTAKGTNQRTGNNGKSLNDNPGYGNLSWYFPNGSSGLGPTILRDNTSSEATFTGTWNAPIVGNEATGYYQASLTGVAATDALTGAAVQEPPYVFSYVVPSSANDPTVAATGYTLSEFNWQFTPPDNTARDYALFAWLPTGPTIDVNGNYIYPPQYFVYEIDYGTGQHYIDIVDRTLVGSGFFRLGNGGNASSVTFRYDGVTPIRLHLLNTVPRDANGNLSGVGLDSTGNLLRSYIVYADAAQAHPDYGAFSASPILGTAQTGSVLTKVFGAYNRSTTTITPTGTTVFTSGTLTAFDYALGNTIWNFQSLNTVNPGTTLIPPGANVTVDPTWTLGPTTPIVYQGAGFYTNTITNNAATYSQVTYSPNISAGSYAVQIWTPGEATFGTAVQVEVDLGATAVYVGTLDLTQTTGFVQIPGTYDNEQATPITVKITNFSSLPGDVGKSAFANSVKFIGAQTPLMTSTPIHATVNIKQPDGTFALTSVVISADESGRIYCLDSAGNGDQTTHAYWVYPSLLSPDPNNSASAVNPNGLAYPSPPPDGSNGATVAQMPTGFNLSSGLVQEVPVGSGNYYLYICSTNGRVYCINMAGNGDYVAGTQTAGSTSRVWSYPNDYPAAAKTSLLGSFTGSIVYNANTAGPTVFLPTAQGRMYALDAVGNGPTLRTTNVRWSYPANTTATLGAINTTPAIANNSLYFGTEILNGTPGQFISLDCNTGALRWFYQGGTEGQTFNWEGGPATAFNNEIGDNTNYIFASNQNGYVYAFDDAGNVKWLTNELNATSIAPLMFTQLQVYDNTGVFTPAPVPIVMVPTNDGNFYGLYANPLTTNRIGTKLAYGYTADGDSITAGMASGHQFMYGADNHGFLYAFSSLGGAGGGIGGPGATVGTPNSPGSQQFNNMTVGFLTPVAYKALRQAQVAGTADYNVYTASGEFITRKAFDFGETLYVMVYNFPYQATDNNGNATAAPPTINFTFSVFGTTYRSVPVESRKWDVNAPQGEDGYAVLGFTLQNAGTSALSPGSGKVSFTVGTVSANGRATNYFLDSSQTQATFNVANPLGIAMSLDSGNVYGLQTDSLGASAASYADPSNPENTFNGTLAGTPTGMSFSPALLGTSFNVLSHASSGSQTIYVYDRSMLALINGPDIGGITNVRVDRPDLTWQGGMAQVRNAITSLYPTLTALQTFEDYPTNFPNDSLDYPDIKRQQMRVTKEPNGTTQNPVSQATSLEIPNNLFIKDANGNNTTQPNPNALTARTPVPTPVEFDLDVPRYQPANLGDNNLYKNGLFTTSSGRIVQNGYAGSVNVYLDSNSNGKLDSTSGRVEAYRVFHLGTGVDVDQRINVITPNVDLGSLTGGNGMRYLGNDVTSNTISQPYAFYNDPSNISPWFAGASIFHSFQASNEGNVNLLNVRVAHRYNTGNNYTLWPIYAGGNDDLSYMDANSFMFSDTDPAFAPGTSIGMTRGEVFGQKPRVGAGTGRRISTNPVRSANANLGTTGSPTDSLANGNIYPISADPQIAVTPPIGFPVGTYSQIIRVINDSDIQDGSLESGVEAYSDPTFNLSFSIRETRLTNSSPSYTSIMSDDLVPYVYDSSAGTRKANTQTYLDANVQPAGMRDLFGGMIAAWSSNRPSATNGTLGGPSGNYSIYFANVAGTTPSGANTASPLGDLKQFKATGANKWFNTAGPYPTQAPATVFGLGATETISANDGAVRYGQPTFPVLGQVSPFDETQSFGQVLMAFNGTALTTSPGGQRTFNELFIAPVTPSNGGNPTVGAPAAMTADPDLPKSKPSIVQVSATQGVMFYGETGTGESRLYYTLFNNGTFSNSVVIPTGYGFQSVTDPSASGRTYLGADAATVAQNGRLLELTFSGKLRGRPNSEIFMTRIPTDVNGAPDMSNSNKELVSFFSMRTGERATAEADRGVFGTQGVQWNTNPASLANPNNGLPFDILVSVGTNAAVSIIDNNSTPVFDQNTGIYTITSTLMGQVYVDTQLGTVRFSSTIPGNTSQVYVTYQPKFLRISATKTSSLTRPSLVWDNRLVGTLNYNPSTFTMLDRFWYRDSAGDHAILGGGGATDPRNARYLMFYNRSAAGPGQSARPMMQTIRFGIQLPGQISTTNTGDVNFSNFSVAGQNGPYQVDPTTGRVYFTQADEDAIVRVTYNGTVANYKVGLITERSESLVPIEQAINEGQVTAFVDPFDPVAVASRRPGLIWLLWSSTRSGTSDVYFETIAPALYPITSSQ